MAHETRDRAGDQSLIDWRVERLARVGFDPAMAERAARDPRFDLHALIELAENGCPPELAVRILAPLEQDAAS
jgi:hypothetical protein